MRVVQQLSSSSLRRRINVHMILFLGTVRMRRTTIVDVRLCIERFTFTLTRLAGDRLSLSSIRDGRWIRTIRVDRLIRSGESSLTPP